MTSFDTTITTAHAERFGRSRRGERGTCYGERRLRARDDVETSSRVQDAVPEGYRDRNVLAQIATQRTLATSRFQRLQAPRIASCTHEKIVYLLSKRWYEQATTPNAVPNDETTRRISNATAGQKTINRLPSHTLPDEIAPFYYPSHGTNRYSFVLHFVHIIWCYFSLVHTQLKKNKKNLSPRNPSLCGLVHLCWKMCFRKNEWCYDVKRDKGRRLALIFCQNCATIYRFFVRCCSRCDVGLHVKGISGRISSFYKFLRYYSMNNYVVLKYAKDFNFSVFKNWV